MKTKYRCWDVDSGRREEAAILWGSTPGNAAADCYRQLESGFADREYPDRYIVVELPDGELQCYRVSASVTVEVSAARVADSGIPKGVRDGA